MGTIETVRLAGQERSRRSAWRPARGTRGEVRTDVERALIGAVGALVPVLAILYTGGLGRLGPELYMNALVAAVVGAVFAWAQPGVENRFGVMQIGMSVPALLASLVVSGEAVHQRNLNEARDQTTSVSTPASVPSTTGRFERGGGTLFGLVAVAHADQATPTVEETPSAGLLEYLGLKARREWYVVTEFYRNERAAQDAAYRLTSPTKAQVRGFETSAGWLYAVVVAQNLTFEQATRVRNDSLEKGLVPKTTRVWTTELKPENIAPGR